MSSKTLKEKNVTEENGYASFLDNELRPSSWQDYIGQKAVKDNLKILIQAATVSSSPPEADTPYDGVTDVAGNSLDGDDDGTAGDDKETGFSVTDDIIVDGPQITLLTPSIFDHNDVEVDGDLTITWDTIMRSSTVTNSTISIYATPDHELWYIPRNTSFDALDVEVTRDDQDPDYTYTVVRHGTFLDSEEDDPTTEADESYTQMYAPVIPDDVQSIYQNCFYPAIGPGPTEASTCEGTSDEPYCCDGKINVKGFNSTTFTCP